MGHNGMLGGNSRSTSGRHSRKAVIEMHRPRRGCYRSGTRSLLRGAALVIVRPCCLRPDSRAGIAVGLGADQFITRPVSQGLVPVNCSEDWRVRTRVVAGAGGVVALVYAVGIVGIASTGHRDDNVKAEKEKIDRKIGESQSLIYAPGFVPPLKA